MLRVNCSVQVRRYFSCYRVGVNLITALLHPADSCYNICKKHFIRIKQNVPGKCRFCYLKTGDRKPKIQEKLSHYAFYTSFTYRWCTDLVALYPEYIRNGGVTDPVVMVQNKGIVEFILFCPNCRHCIRKVIGRFKF